MFGQLLSIVIAAEIPQFPINHRTVGEEMHPTQVSVWNNVINHDNGRLVATLATLIAKVGTIYRRFETAVHFILVELGGGSELREQVLCVDWRSRGFLLATSAGLGLRRSLGC